jgi:sec-independent protein translocase protein TatA
MRPDRRATRRTAMQVGPLQLLLIAVLALLLFGGRNKISSLMKDFAEGIKGFRKGLAEDEDKQAAPATRINDDPKTVDTTAAAKDRAGA